MAVVVDEGGRRGSGQVGDGFVVAKQELGTVFQDHLAGGGDRVVGPVEKVQVPATLDGGGAGVGIPPPQDLEAGSLDDQVTRAGDLAVEGPRAAGQVDGQGVTGRGDPAAARTGNAAGGLVVAEHQRARQVDEVGVADGVMAAGVQRQGRPALDRGRAGIGVRTRQGQGAGMQVHAA